MKENVGLQCDIMDDGVVCVIAFGYLPTGGDILCTSQVWRRSMLLDQ
jgi:hypothetical protein